MLQLHRILLPFLAAAMLLPCLSANADTGTTAAAGERPRVGLVLGGGGARGATHIGVLRELERMRIPIDAIAGTSMGALVGGLYAAGATTAELEELAGSIDWINELADAPHRRDLNFRRKEDDRQFPIDVELGLLDGEVAMPMGLVQGHRLDLLLHDLTIDVSHIKDFDRLPIPFRAVTTDLETAEPFVLDHGDLAHALRASMSVPGIFSPTEIDGRMLVDGGIVANLPVDVMREMGVDVIIAIDAEFPLYPRQDLDSAIKVSEQVLTILIVRETRRQIGALGDRDILIRPDLGTFASTDFGDITSVIQPGADATLEFAEQLEPLAIDAEAYAEFSARRASIVRRERRVDFVRIVHDGTLADATLEARVQVKAGDRIDTERMTADADRIFGLGLYEDVSYRLIEEDGRQGVEYRATTKSWGTNDLLFGLSLEEGFTGNAAFNVNARLTRVGLNRQGAEWRTDLQLGTEPHVFSEFYQPLAAGSSWFVAPRLELKRSRLSVFQSQDEIAELRVSTAEAALDAGRELGYSGEFRLGIYRGNGETRVRIGDPGISRTDFDTGGVFAQMRFDTQDNAHFPERGVRAKARWDRSRTALGADNEFDIFEVDLMATWSRGRNSYDASLVYATTDAGTGAIQDLVPLGGFRRLSGLEKGAISGPHAAAASLVYRRRMGSSIGVFDVPIYLGASLEIGNVWQSRADISFDSALFNGSVFAGLDTYFGPLFLAAGFAEGGERNYYLLLGAMPR